MSAQVTFTDNSGAVSKEVEKAIKRALFTIGGMAERDVSERITRNHSVVTGNLRDSITHRAVDNHTIEVGTTVEYAPYVELGTVRANAKPYLRPTLEENFGKYKEVWAEELREIK